MKHYGKLTAAAAAGFMALNVLNVAPVFAENDQQGESVATGKQIGETATIGKTMSTRNGLTTPKDTSFSFQAVGSDDLDAGTPSETAGVGQKFIGINGAVTISNADQNDNPATKDVIEFANSTVSVDTSKFDYPGTYVYKVTEDNTTVPGVSKDTKSYIMQVFITRTGTKQSDDNSNDKNNPLKVEGFTFSEKTENGTLGAKVDSPSFENTYNPDPVNITKTITGNQANMNEKFAFEIVITGEPGTTYTYKTKTGTTETIQINDNEESVTIGTTQIGKLGNGDSVTIDGLTSRDIYTVTEVYNEYDPSVNVVSVNNGNETSAEGALTKDTNAKKATYSGEGSNAATTKTVAFTNDKSGTIPTGILMSAAPFAGLIGLGGVFAGLFFRRKRED